MLSNRLASVAPKVSPGLERLLELGSLPAASNDTLAVFVEDRNHVLSGGDGNWKSCLRITTFFLYVHSRVIRNRYATALVS
jgi:hypothetical protein